MVKAEESSVGPSLLQRVEVVVELVKDDYLVLSLPKYGGIVGYASTRDFNLRTLDPHQHYCPGQRFKATVAHMPEEGSGGRLLLLVDVSETPRKNLEKRGETSFVIGAVVEGKVLAVQPLFMDVKLGKHVRGRLHVSQLPGEHEPGSCPMKDFKVGSTLKARVVGTLHSLPDGNPEKRSGAGHVLMDLSMLMDNTTDGISPDIRPAFQSMDEVEVGQEVTAYIKEVKSDWAHLQLSTHIRGTLFVLDSSSEPSQLSNFSSRFKPGEAVRCQVLFKDLEKQSLRLAMVGSSHEVGTAEKKKGEELTVDGELSVGKVLGGRIIRVLPDFRGLNIQLGLGLFGRVSIVEIRDDWLTNPLEGFKEGQFVRCVVIGFGNSDAFGGASKQVNLSLRESLGGCGGEQANALREDKGEGGHEGPHIQRLEDLKTGMEVCGYVKSCTPKGCFVSFAQNMDGLVLIKNLSKDYIKEPVKAFPPGRLVNARVVNVDVLSNRVELSLVPLESEKGPNWLREEDVQVGVVVTGTVKRIQPFGAFISIENSNLVGMCHISEVSDDFTKDLRVALSVGQRVRAKVLKVDSGKIALTMKGSLLREAEEQMGVDSEGEEGGEGESESEGEEVEREDEEEGEGEEGEDEEEGLVAESEELEDEDDEEGEATTSAMGNGQGKRKREKEVGEGISIKKVPAVMPLEVNLDESLEKSEDKNEEDEGEGVGGDEGEDTQKKSKRAKKRNKEEREAAIRVAEERRVAGEAAPSSMEDYERLCLSSPSSSYVWIKYMAFLLSLTEVEKARAVAERALATIPYREEGEKMNVWVAYLALENMHGDPPKEAVLKLFQRALQYCDPKKLHLALLGLYERTDQHSLADELFRSMTRKFGTSAKVWLRNIQNLLNRGLQEAARKVLDRSLLSLPKRKHIKVISRSALLEFKHGTPERARAMFDGILRNYPKRIDLWSTYIDQEIRLKDQDVIRRLFERAISLDLPAKKMKSLFKKYLDYEKEYGNAETVDQVKAKAMAYVEGRVG